ncbi:YopX family protein [Enterococcus malodoratus]|uniref:YopX family protein n=1 Tax=Enterococcus malodoratus TaxID=71451 RepID=UPI0039B05038
MIPKFRAWYTPFGGSVKQFNKMKHGSAGSLLTHAEMSPDDYKIMQSTGLKDKNSVEIYEGDVVKWGDTLGGEETPIRIATVKIEPDILFDSNVGIFNYGQFAYKNTEKFLTILGNIYENPELLEAR